MGLPKVGGTPYIPQKTIQSSLKELPKQDYPKFGNPPPPPKSARVRPPLRPAPKDCAGISRLDQRARCEAHKCPAARQPGVDYFVLKNPRETNRT